MEHKEKKSLYRGGQHSLELHQTLTPENCGKTFWSFTHKINSDFFLLANQSGLLTASRISEKQISIMRETQKTESKHPAALNAEQEVKFI